MKGNVMKISKENYEAIAIDYLDGRLDKHNREAFEAFLAMHPEIAEEIELLSGVSLDLKETTKAEVLPKELLFKNATLVEADGGDVLDDICIDIIERAYKKEDAHRIETELLAHNRSKKRLETYRKTLMVPDYSTVFPDKTKLFRQNRLGLFQKSTVRWALLGVAASVMIMLGIHQLSQDEALVSISSPQMVAEANSHKEVKEKASQKGENIAGENKTPSDAPKNSNIAKPVPTDEKRVMPTKKTTNSSHQRPVIKIRTEEPIVLAKASKIEVGLKPAKRQEATLVSVDFVEQDVSKVPVPEDRYSLSKLLALNINKYVFQKDPQSPQAQTISMWDVADLGISGVNKVVGTNMELERKYNEQGEIVKLAFYSKPFSYEKKSSN